MRNREFSGLAKVPREFNEYPDREARKLQLSEHIDRMNLADGCNANKERKSAHGIRHATENTLFISCSYINFHRAQTISNCLTGGVSQRSS
jgi:hypothetical protein